MKTVYPTNPRHWRTLLLLAFLVPVTGFSQDVRMLQLYKRPDLPPPLVTEFGKKVTTPELWWENRRPEILGLFETYVYGAMPPAPDNTAFTVTREDKTALDGKATLREITITYGPEGAPPIYLLLVTPNGLSEPAPVFLGLNFRGNHSTIADPKIRLSTAWIPSRSVGVVDNRATEAARGTSAGRWPFALAVERGYAVATYYHGDIDPDTNDPSNGVQAAYYADGQKAPKNNEWGSLAAWGWGLHRAVDYLVQTPEIDPKRIAVMGHSRNGKAALWAGATDPRIALIVSNQSGCGGAAISRRREGEKVVDINNHFPHWFSENFKRFNDREAYLPVDQHLLIALAAPRPVLVASAEEDHWADPKGEFLALKEAAPVYALLNAGGLDADEMPPTNQLVKSRLGYHIRPGVHGVGAADWTVFMDFADTHWGKPK